MAGDLPLERYHRLQAGAADLRRLPFAAKVDGQTVTREGQDLVVLHEGRTERFREAEVPKRGLRGLFGGAETGVWWHDGADSRLIRPDGSTGGGEFPGGVPDDAALRDRTRAAEALLAGATTPLQKAVLDVPFGSLEIAKSALQATAPALPGPSGTAALAVAMAEAHPATAARTLPVLQAELAARTEPLPLALAGALRTPPRDPVATLRATASLLQAGLQQQLTLDLALHASRMPGGSHLVPALLSATPGVPPDSWTGRFLSRAPQDLSVLPSTAAEYLQAASRLDPAGRRDLLAAARGLGAEGDLLADLAATAEADTLARVLEAPTPGEAAAAALAGDPKNVARLLAYAARNGDRTVGTVLAVGGLRTTGRYESPRGAQAAVLPPLLAGDVAGALKAGLETLSSRQAVLDLAGILLPDLAQPNARVLEDLLDQTFGGQYESLNSTLRAGLEGLGEAPVDFAARLLATTAYSTSQKAIVRAVAAHAPKPLPLALRLAERLAAEPFQGQYESFGATANALLKQAPLLQAALGSTTYASSQRAIVTHWLEARKEEGTPAPPATETFLRGLVAQPFAGQYESMNATLAAVVPRLDDPLVAMAEAALGTTSYTGTNRGIVKALAEAAEDPATRRMATFLQGVAACPFSGQYESMNAALKAALAAPQPGDSPGQAVLRAGLAAVATTPYAGTKLAVARAAAAAATPAIAAADVSALFRSPVRDEDLQADPAAALQRLLDGWSETPPPAQGDAPVGEIRREPEQVTIGGITLPVNL